MLQQIQFDFRKWNLYNRFCIVDSPINWCVDLHPSKCLCREFISGVILNNEMRDYVEQVFNNIVPIQFIYTDYFSVLNNKYYKDEKLK